MSTEMGILDLTFPAGEDLSSDQFKILLIAADSTYKRIVRKPLDTDAGTTALIGVLQNAPSAAGKAAVVRVKGISKVVLGETVAIGEYIKAECVADTGNAGRALDADGALDIAIGLCTQGGAVDELGEVLLAGMTYQVGIAS